MGISLSCVPCLPSKSKVDHDGQVPYSDISIVHLNEKGKRQSVFNSARRREKLDKSLLAANKNGLVEEVTRELQEVTHTGSETSGGGDPSFKRASGGKKKSARERSESAAEEETEGVDFYSCLRSVLHDKQLTALAILTSTIIGSFAGVLTMSGLVGAVFYLIVLFVQITGSVFSTMLTLKRREAAAAKEVPLVVVKPVKPARNAPAKAEGFERENISPRSAVVATPIPIPQEWACETRTKHKFPFIMNEHDSYPKEIEALVGLGIRDKRVLGMTIDVYALGLYLNVSQFRAKFCSEYNNTTREHLQSLSRQVFDDVICSTESVARTIRIVIQFSGLTSKMLVKAFDERLEKVMKEAGESDVYSELRSGLSSINLYPGRVILLRMKTNGYLIASSDNEILANVQSHTLCKATTDIYLGTDSASPSLMADMASMRLYDVLHSPILRKIAPGPEAEEKSVETEEKQLDEKSDDLSGTWEVTEAENVEEFLATLGISYLVRKIAVHLYTKDMKIIEQSGKDVCFTDYRNKRKGKPVLFQENKVIERKDKQGRDLKDVAHWEGSCLVLRTEGYQSPLLSKYWRASMDTMVSETTVKDVTMKRRWKLQD